MMSARDRKLLMILAPLAAFALYWLLLMHPALDRRASLRGPLTQAQSERDKAVNAAQKVTEDRQSYERDYAQLVRLSKAIPQSVAVSDLMRELNSSAKGLGIDFSNITMAPEAPSDSSTPSSTSEPVVEGLDQIPVELTFSGRFFALSDLFHSIQRFVSVADGRLQVHGRLIRIDEFSFDSSSFPSITAQLKATIYAAPADEGPTGGASPVGPPGAERGDGDLHPTQNFSPAALVNP